MPQSAEQKAWSQVLDGELLQYVQMKGMKLHDLELELGIKAPAISARLTRLRVAGVIRRSHLVELARDKIGIAHDDVVLLKLRNQADQDAVLENLEGFREIYEVHELRLGEYNLMASVASSGEDHRTKVLKRIGQLPLVVGLFVQSRGRVLRQDPLPVYALP